MVGGSRGVVEPSPSPSAVATPEVTAATIEARVPIPGAVPGMAFGSATTADAVWVTSTLSVVRIDPTSNATLTVALPDASAISGLATSAAGVFVADNVGNAVYRIDPASNTVVGRIDVGRRPVRDRRRRFVRLGPPGRLSVDRADRDRQQQRGEHIRGAGRCENDRPRLRRPVGCDLCRSDGPDRSSDRGGPGDDRHSSGGRQLRRHPGGRGSLDRVLRDLAPRADRRDDEHLPRGRGRGRYRRRNGLLRRQGLGRRAA